MNTKKREETTAAEIVANTGAAGAVADIDRAKVAANIESAIDAAPRAASWRYSFVDTRNVRGAVDNLARQIHRSEAAAGLYRFEVLRDVFRKFDGKLINRRLWSAVASACYEYMPAGKIVKHSDGSEYKPAAVRMCEGTFCASAHFARVWFDRDYFGGETCDELIFGRCADWTKCQEEDKNEYKIITGQRLDAARALAVLDYEAERAEMNAREIRAALEHGAEYVAKYEAAVVQLADVLDGIPYQFRDAFKLGSRGSLYVIGC